MNTTAPTKKNILVFAPTDTLHLDKRIVQTCNSLAQAGHEVQVLASPQTKDFSSALKEMIHPSVTLHLLPFTYPDRFYHYDLDFYYAGEYKSKFFKRLSCKLNYYTHLIPHPGRPFFKNLVVKFIWNFYWRVFMPLLCRSGKLNDYFLFFYLGPKKYSEYHDVMKLNYWSTFYIYKSFEIYAHKRIDALYANDLWSLPIGAALKSIWNVPLIYDSHEIGTTIIDNPKLRKIAERKEEWLYKQADKMLTVNDSVAKFYKDKFPFLDPKVIVNAPIEFKDLPKKENSIIRQKAADPGCVIGVVATFLGRTHGLEKFFEAFKLTKNDVRLIIIGEGAAKNTLIEMAEKAGLLDTRVFFMDGIPFHKIIPTIAGADFGLVPNKRGLNHNLNSPSKLYEYIQAELPVFSDKQLEVDKIFQEYPIGVTVDYTLDTQVIAQALDRFCDDLKTGKFSQALKQAKPHFKWPDNFSEIVLRNLPLTLA